MREGRAVIRSVVWAGGVLVVGHLHRSAVAALWFRLCWLYDYRLSSFLYLTHATVWCFHSAIFRSEQQPPNEGGGGDGGEGEGGADNEGGGGGLTDADFDSNWDEAIETFDGMDLPEELLRGIYSYGFEKPSAIQQRAIQPVMLGRDLIAQAQSGTVSLAELRLAWDETYKNPWTPKGRTNHAVKTPSFESEKSHPRRV